MFVGFFWIIIATTHLLSSVGLVSQSCPTLCNPMDCSPPGSSVHGILQARILEWVAISSFRGSAPYLAVLPFIASLATSKVKVKSLSPVWLFATSWTVAYQLLRPWDFQARILEWTAISFSRRSSRPRDWTRVSRIIGRRFTVWATRDVQGSHIKENLFPTN